MREAQIQPYQLTKEQARQFLLLQHGLLGEYRYKDKAGVMEFIHNAGCIQFDPVDLCGRNDHILLFSRVKNYELSMLNELLYHDRALVDYFDKNLSVFPAEDWKFFSRTRQAYCNNSRSKQEVQDAAGLVLAEITKKGPMCSQDFEASHKVDWYWSKTALHRAALEYLYFSGQLIVHHKKRTIKYYDLPRRHFSSQLLEAQDPNETMEAYWTWHYLRRIQGVGLLWNKASDAWLCIRENNALVRKQAFETLLQQGRIYPIQVEGLADLLYCSSTQLPLLEQVLKGITAQPRLEFLAPLDSFLWDRKLIGALFDFQYKWEVYTPAHMRSYGCYVLPVLWKDHLVGRIELLCRRKEGVLLVKNFWLEPGAKCGVQMKKAMENRLAQYGVLQHCPKVVWEK